MRSKKLKFCLSAIKNVFLKKHDFFLCALRNKNMIFFQKIIFLRALRNKNLIFFLKKIFYCALAHKKSYLVKNKKVSDFSFEQYPTFFIVF